MKQKFTFTDSVLLLGNIAVTPTKLLSSYLYKVIQDNKNLIFQFIKAS